MRDKWGVPTVKCPKCGRQKQKDAPCPNCGYGEEDIKFFDFPDTL